ncbi:hypothetical protein L5515_003661 [Caenorhabditis briggsae]|nr:hypothetical protein L5515_003661 [Caenorhabditis briggsae]
MQKPSPGNVQKKASSEILFADYGKNRLDGEDPTPENKRVIDLFEPVDAMSLNREKDRVVVSGIRGVLQVIKIQKHGSGDFEAPSIVKDLDMRVYRKGKVNILYSAQNVKWNQLYDQYIATTSSNGSIVCWNISRRNKSVFKAHERSATCLDWHATAPYILVSGSRDCTVRSYDMRVKDSHQLTFKCDRNCESIRDIAMNKDQGCEDYFFTGDDGGVLRLWDLRQTKRWIFEKVAHRSFVSTMSMNPHNRRLIATGGGRDKMVKIWEWTGPELVRVSVVETTAPLGRLAWRPDKPYHLATCASVNETSVHVWDVRRPYLPYVTYDEHRDAVTDACWPSNDFDVFMTCGKDGLVVLHNIDSGHAPISFACDVAFDITPDGTMGLAVNSEIHAKNEAEMVSRNAAANGKKSIHQIPYESFQKPIKSLIGFGVPEALTHSLPPTTFHQIAQKYIIGGVEITQLCETNAKVARKNGLEHVAQTWRLVEALCEQAKIQEEYDRKTAEEKARIVRAWAIRKKELAEEGRRWLANLNDHYRDDVKKQVSQRLENTQHVTAFLRFSSSSESDDESDSEQLGDGENNQNEDQDKMAPNFDILNKNKKRKKKKAIATDFYFGAGEQNFKGGNLETIHVNEFMGLGPEAYELRDEEKERRFFCKARKQPRNAEEYEHLQRELEENEADFQEWSPMLEIYRLLLYHAEQGDMQTCATVSMVCGKRLLDAVDHYTINGWIKCYMEMLYSLELFLVMAKIRKYCTLDSISSVSRENTTIQLAHADCDAMIVNGRCTKCEALAQADCTLCRFSIVGMTFQCHVCGHCMHADHAYEWFKKENTCAFVGCPCTCGKNTWPDMDRTFIGNDEIMRDHRKFSDYDTDDSDDVDSEKEPDTNRVDASRLDTDSEISAEEDVEWSPGGHRIRRKYDEFPNEGMHSEWSQYLVRLKRARKKECDSLIPLDKENQPSVKKPTSEVPRDILKERYQETLRILLKSEDARQAKKRKEILGVQEGQLKKKKKYKEEEPDEFMEQNVCEYLDPSLKTDNWPKREEPEVCSKWGLANIREEDEEMDDEKTVYEKSEIYNEKNAEANWEDYENYVDEACEEFWDSESISDEDTGSLTDEEDEILSDELSDGEVVSESLSTSEEASDSRNAEVQKDRITLTRNDASYSGGLEEDLEYSTTSDVHQERSPSLPSSLEEGGVEDMKEDDEENLVFFDDGVLFNDADLDCDDYIESLGPIGLQPYQMEFFRQRAKNENDRVTSPTLTAAVKNGFERLANPKCFENNEEKEDDLFCEKPSVVEETTTTSEKEEEFSVPKPILSFGEKARMILSMSKHDLKRKKAKKRKKEIIMIYSKMIGGSTSSEELSPDEFMVSSDSSNSCFSGSTRSSGSSESDLFHPQAAISKEESEDCSSDSTSHKELSAMPEERLLTPLATGDLYLKTESPSLKVVYKMNKWNKVSSQVTHPTESAHGHANNTYFICAPAAANNSPGPSRNYIPSIPLYDSLPRSYTSRCPSSPSSSSLQTESEEDPLEETLETPSVQNTVRNQCKGSDDYRNFYKNSYEYPHKYPPEIDANQPIQIVNFRLKDNPPLIPKELLHLFENPSTSDSPIPGGGASNAVNPLFELRSSAINGATQIEDQQRTKTNAANTLFDARTPLPTTAINGNLQTSSGKQTNASKSFFSHCSPFSTYVADDENTSMPGTSQEMPSNLFMIKDKTPTAYTSVRPPTPAGELVEDSDEEELFSTDDEENADESETKEELSDEEASDEEPFFPFVEDIPRPVTTKHPWETEEQYQSRMRSEQEEDVEEKKELDNLAREESERKEREAEEERKALLTRHTSAMRALEKRKRRAKLKVSFPPKPNSLLSAKRGKFTSEEFEARTKKAIENLKMEDPSIPETDQSDFERFVREKEVCHVCKHAKEDRRFEREYLEWVKSRSDQVIFVKSFDEPCAAFQLAYLSVYQNSLTIARKTAKYLIQFIKIFYFIEWNDMLKNRNEFVLKEVYELWKNFQAKRRKVCRGHFRDFRFRFFASSIATKIKQQLLRDEAPQVKQALLDYDWVHLRSCINEMDDPAGVMDEAMDTLVVNNPHWSIEEKKAANRYWDLFGNIPLHIETSETVVVPPLSEDRLDMVDDTNYFTKKMLRNAARNSRTYDIKLTYTKRKKQEDLISVQNRTRKVQNREWQMRLEKMVNESRYVDLSESSFRVNPHDKLLYTADQNQAFPICQFDTGTHYVTVQPMVSKKMIEMKSHLRRKFTFRRTYHVDKQANHIEITTEKLRQLPAFKKFDSKLQRAQEYKDMLSRNFKIFDKTIVEHRRKLETIVEEQTDIPHTLGVLRKTKKQREEERKEEEKREKEEQERKEEGKVKEGKVEENGKEEENSSKEGGTEEGTVEKIDEVKEKVAERIEKSEEVKKEVNLEIWRKMRTESVEEVKEYVEQDINQQGGLEMKNEVKLEEEDQNGIKEEVKEECKEEGTEEVKDEEDEVEEALEATEATVAQAAAEAEAEAIALAEETARLLEELEKNKPEPPRLKELTGIQKALWEKCQKDILADYYDGIYKDKLGDFERHEQNKMTIMKKHHKPELRKKIFVARRVLELGRLMVEHEVRKWMAYQYDLLYTRKTVLKKSRITRKLLKKNFSKRVPCPPPAFCEQSPLVPRKKQNRSPPALRYNSSSDEDDYDKGDERPKKEKSKNTYSKQPNLLAVAGKLQKIFKDQLNAAPNSDDEWEYSDDSSIVTWFNDDTDDVLNRLINRDYVDEHMVLRERMKGSLGRPLHVVKLENLPSDESSDEEVVHRFEKKLEERKSIKKGKRVRFFEKRPDPRDIGNADGKARDALAKMEVERDRELIGKKYERKKDMEQVRGYFKQYALDHSYSPEPYSLNEDLSSAISFMHRCELRRVSNRLEKTMKEDYENRCEEDNMIVDIIPIDHTSLECKMINFLMFQRKRESCYHSEKLFDETRKILSPIQKYELFFGKEGAYKLALIGKEALENHNLRYAFTYIARRFGTTNLSVPHESLRSFYKLWWLNSFQTLEQFILANEENDFILENSIDIVNYYRRHSIQLARETYDQLEVTYLLNEVVDLVTEYVDDIDTLFHGTPYMDSKKYYAGLGIIDWYHEKYDEKNTNCSNKKEKKERVKKKKRNLLSSLSIESVSENEEDDQCSPSTEPVDLPAEFIKISPDEQPNSSDSDPEYAHYSTRRNSVKVGKANKEMMSHYAAVYDKLKVLQAEKQQKKAEEICKKKLEEWERKEREGRWAVDDMERKIHDFVVLAAEEHKEKSRTNETWWDVISQKQEFKDEPTHVIYDRVGLSAHDVLEKCGLPVGLDNQMFNIEMEECQAEVESLTEDASDIADSIEKDFKDEIYGLADNSGIDDDAQSYSSMRHVLKHELYFQRELESGRRIPTCVFLFTPEQFFEDNYDTNLEFNKWRQIIEVSECPFSFNKLVMRERLLLRCREECQEELLGKYFQQEERNRGTILEVFQRCLIIVVVDSELKPFDCRVVSSEDLSKPAHNRVSYLRKLMVENSQHELSAWIEKFKIDMEVYAQCPVIPVLNEDLKFAHTSQFTSFFIEEHTREDWLMIRRDEGVRALDTMIRLPPPPAHKLSTYKMIFKPIYDSWYHVWKFENDQACARTPVVRKHDPVKEYLHKARMIVNYAHQHYRMKRFDSLMSKDPTEFQLVDRSDVPSASLFDSLDAAVSKFCNEDSPHLDPRSRQVVKDTLIQLATGKIPYFTANYFGGYDYTRSIKSSLPDEEEENKVDKFPLLASTELIQPDVANTTEAELESCDEEIQWLRSLYEDTDFQRRRIMAKMLFEIAQKALFKLAPNLADFERGQQRFEHLLTLHGRNRPLLDMMLTKVRGTFHMKPSTNRFLYNTKLITFGELVDSRIHPRNWSKEKVSLEEHRRQTPKDPQMMIDFLRNTKTVRLRRDSDSDSDQGSECSTTSQTEYEKPLRYKKSLKLEKAYLRTTRTKKRKRKRVFLTRAMRDMIIAKLRETRINMDIVFAREKRALGAKKWKIRRTINKCLQRIAKQDYHKLKAKLPAKKQEALNHIRDLIIRYSDVAHRSWGTLKMQTRIRRIPPVDRMQPKHFNRIEKGQKMYKPPKQYDPNNPLTNGRKWF